MTEVAEKPAKEKIVRKQLVRIMPYIDETNENMGLSKYKMVLHDGANHGEQLASLGNNESRRYLTGLNEFAPEVLALKGEEHAAAVKAIREKVIFLEKAFGANEIDINEEKFWDKVKTVYPKNYAFWDEFFVNPGNEPVFLDPTEPRDLILISAIEAGGFSIVAKSYEDLKLHSTPPKWYLDKESDTVISNNEVKKVKNKAFGVLETLNDKDPRKMFYVIKNIDKNSYQYNNSTSPEVIYSYLNDFIEGKGWERSPKKAPTTFLNVVKMSTEDLRLKAVIADASFYKIIQGKADGLIYHTLSDSMLGRNIEEVFGKLKNTIHADMSLAIQKEVEAKWKD